MALKPRIPHLTRQYLKCLWHAYILHFVAYFIVHATLTFQPSDNEAEIGYPCLGEQLRLSRDEVWRSKNMHDSMNFDEAQQLVGEQSHTVENPHKPCWLGSSSLSSFRPESPHLWLSIDMHIAPKGNKAGCTDPKIIIITTAFCFFCMSTSLRFTDKIVLHK